MNFKRFLTQTSRCTQSLSSSCIRRGPLSMLQRTHSTAPQSPNSNTTKDSLIASLFKNNNLWQDSDNNVFRTNVDNVLNTQIPIATLLTCCDSRVPSSALGLLSANKTFEIRNIGNQAPNALGSIGYGTQALKTPYLLIMGHTNCGAVIGALSDYSGLTTDIQRELMSLVKSTRYAEYVLNDKKENLDKNIVSELNVDFQVKQLLQNNTVQSMVNKGDLTIVGMMFDIHNIYDQGHGQVYFVNVNGEANTDKLKSNSLFNDLSDDETNKAVRRLYQYPNNFDFDGFSESL